MKNRHARDRGVWLHGNGIDGVISANDEGDVRIGKVVIDLVHFQDNCTCQHIQCRKSRQSLTIVRHRCLGEKHVTLTGHSASDRVDGEADVHASSAEETHDLG